MCALIHHQTMQTEEMAFSMKFYKPLELLFFIKHTKAPLPLHFERRTHLNCIEIAVSNSQVHKSARLTTNIFPGRVYTKVLALNVCSGSLSSKHCPLSIHIFSRRRDLFKPTSLLKNTAAKSALGLPFFSLICMKYNFYSIFCFKYLLKMNK
jgi:hypothetical protein